MHSNIRLVISFGIACVGCLATALLALPATAGTNSWTEIGQFGSPFAFAVDPASPSTIYAVNGKTVMKTTDGGGTWADLAFFAVDSVDYLVIDPRSPATIYAVMGPLWDLVDVPIYKSIDGGAHWAAEAAEFNGSPASVVAIAPSLSSTLYAGEGSAVFKSIDGGLSWAMRSNGLTGFFVSALAIDPTNADVVYVAQQVFAPSGDPGPGQVFKSTDGGEQWWQVPISVPAEITSLAIDPSTPARIYAATDQGGVFKSVDSGETWTAAQNGLPDTIYVYALAIDRSTPARIYAATDHGVFMSADAAASWTPINSGLTSLYVFGLSIDRTGSLLRAVTADGLFEYQIAGSPPSGTVDLNQHGLTGSWYDPALSGQGIVLEVYPNAVATGIGYLFGSWFTFEPIVVNSDYDGEQRWYTLGGEAAAGQSSATLTIYENVGGNFNALPVTSAAAVGWAVLSFQDCATATMEYAFFDGSRYGVIPLVRLTPNVTCSASGETLANADFGYSGTWFDPATSGQGFAFEVNPNAATVFFGWFTYGPEGQSWWSVRRQSWFTGQGGYIPGTRSATVTLYETQAGAGDGPDPVTFTRDVGTATVTFFSCDAASLTFTFPRGANIGESGTINLSRVGPTPADCGH